MTENPTPRQTFAEATEEFVRAADWLGPEHAPAVATLRLSAAQLDRELTSALLGQYNLTYRALLRAQPVDPDAADPLELELRAREAGR